MNAKKLIQGIRKQMDARGEPKSNRDIAKLVGVSAGSIDNWSNNRCAVTEANVSKLEEALASLSGGSVAKIAPPPPEIAPKTNGHANGAGEGGRIKKLLGEFSAGDVTEVKEEKKEAKEKLGNPVDNGMRIPNMKEESAKLANFIRSVGLKPIGPQAPVLCDDGNVIWHFVATFPHKSPSIIIKSRNEHNREVGAKKAVKYGRDMATGKWRFTGEPIIFSRDGDLLDGQNRMNALRGFYEKFPDRDLLQFLVVLGMNPRVSTHMGRPYMRTNEHQNQVEGRSYSHVRTPTMNLIHRLEMSGKAGEGHDYLEEIASDGVLKSSRQTELNDLYDKEVESALEFVHGLNWGIGTKALAKHIGTFMLMLMTRKSPEAARYFTHSLADATFALPGTPVYALRDRLKDFAVDKATGKHEATVVKYVNKGNAASQIARGADALVMRYIASAWNSFCAGRGGVRQIKASSESTAQILNSLAVPGPKAIEESQKLTPEVYDSVIARSKACRVAQEKKALEKNRDEGDLKKNAVAQAIDTE